MSTPIVIAGTTDAGTRYAQVWDAEHRLAGVRDPRPHAMVQMSTGQGAAMLSIDQLCPTRWIDLALSMFDTFRRGDLPKSTHTVVWAFGRPEFTPIADEPEHGSEALFSLEESRS